MAFGSAAALFSCVAGAFASASFFSVLSPALDSVSKAWKMWNGVASDGREPAWPAIEMDILEPKLGVKIAPRGVHPKAYLQDLPELKDYIIMDAEIAYTSSIGDEVTITSYGDWLSFFHQLDHGDAHKRRLRLKFKTQNGKHESLYQKSTREISAVSEKLRNFGKSLMMGEDVPVENLEKEITFLETQGFSQFEGKGLVFEELGYTKEDWPELIDDLVEAGIPEVWGKTLKLAAKAKRGSVKSLATNSYLNGVRGMTYMKFQILPDGEGGVDGLFAIYTLKATASAETTGMRVEQSFKRYVELDAHTEWKKEVRQFLPDTKAKKPSDEL